MSTAGNNSSISSMEQSLKQCYVKNNVPIPSVFSNNQLRIFLNESSKYVSSQDFKYIFEDLAKDQNQFTMQEATQIYYELQKQARKVYNRVQPPICTFLFESLIKTVSNQDKEYSHSSSIKIDYSDSLCENKIDIRRSFSQILSEDYLKKLINMGANGLINQKQEQKVNKYCYNHWVQTNQINFLSTQTQRLQVQLLKSIWLFDFPKAMKIADIIYQKIQTNQLNQQEAQSYIQISSLIPGLQNLNQLSIILQKYPLLRGMVEGRSKFQIQFKEQFLRKIGILTSQEISGLQQQFNDLMQLWNFTQQYFEMIENQLQNPYFRQIALFINSNRDDKQKTQEDVQQFSKLQEIGIIERFLYTKKYFSQEHFELFKQLIKQKSDSVSQIDYILLFGNKKQSERILQNYVDETNDIQKVALISVYLKTFSEQAKMVSTLRGQQKSFYGKFIYVYQWLLDKIDGGISRHKFDKKCLQIQIQRKRKNLTKTFTFDCTNCKAPQIYSVLSKKISIDSKQPKLKGYHYFAKDNRSQIMHCIQCMIMLPKCSICLYPISVFNAYAQEMKKNVSQKKATNKGEPINKAVVWCPKCKHGGHFDHIIAWFSQQKRKCPVSNCKCKCSI